MKGHEPAPAGVSAVAAAMRRDWDDRACRDAMWFINMLRAGQSEAEFDESGRREVEELVLPNLDVIARDGRPASLCMLEIGCGAGRMTRHLARIFGEVHATDVSPKMLDRAHDRLGMRPSIHLHLTNGVDFAQFAGDHFDYILSAFVYQHVPSAVVVHQNLTDAYRVLKPGGTFQFQTNGVTNPQYARYPKDTWAGDTFPETSVRALARELGAQLVAIWGTETQYCWTFLRKPRRPRALAAAATPAIVAHGEAPSRAGVRRISLLVAGMDQEWVDCNRVTVTVGGRAVVPDYVGPPRSALRGTLMRPTAVGWDSLHQVDCPVPSRLPSGRVTVTVALDSGEISAPYCLGLDAAGPCIPRVVLVTNACHGGLDIADRGPESRVRVFLDREPPGGVEPWLVLGRRRVRPEASVFVPSNGCYMVEMSLPRGTGPGDVPVYVEVGGVRHAPFTVRVRRGRRTVGGLARRVRLLARRIIARLRYRRHG